MLGPRTWIATLGWCAATLASIGVATVALQPVLRTATPDLLDPPAPVARPTTPSPALSPAPARPSPGRSGSASPSGTVTADGWTVSTGTDGQPVYLRSFRTCGGRAVIRVTPGQVRLVTATPDPGFSVDTVQNEPGNLAVQFTAQARYCLIHALWYNNGPYAE